MSYINCSTKKKKQNLPCKSVWCETAGVDQRQRTKTICLLSFNSSLVFSARQFFFWIILFSSFHSIHQLHSTVQYKNPYEMGKCKTMKIYRSSVECWKFFSLSFTSFWYDFDFLFSVRYLKKAVVKMWATIYTANARWNCKVDLIYGFSNSTMHCTIAMK